MNPAEVIAESMRAVATEGAREDGQLWGAFPNTMTVHDLAEHVVSVLSEHGYSIVEKATVEWFILKGGFFKQAGSIYSGPYVDREDAFRARNTIERIEDTHEYFIDSRPVAAAAAEEDQ